MERLLKLKLTGNDLIRFESKINYNGRQTIYADTPCHEWTDALQHGYGHFSYRSITYLAHAVAKMHYHGFEIDPSKPRKDQFCCHKCHNRACVNADHIYIGSHTDNMRDKLKAGTDARGEKHGQAVISNELAQEIKFAINAKKVWKYGDNKRMAEEFGIPVRIFENIKYGTNWNYLQDKPIFEDE